MRKLLPNWTGQMITGLRVKNLRAIADSKKIKFRKINVLVGRNSAGKSTLLRVLPLLRQSIEQRTKGPILWFGRFVDFGSFRNALRSPLDGGQNIWFEFDARLDPRRRGARATSRFVPGPNVSRQFSVRQPINVVVSISLGASDQGDYGNVRELRLTFPEDTAIFKFDGYNTVTRVEVNGADIKLRSGQRWMVQQGRLLPLIDVLKLQDFTNSDGQKQQYYLYDDQPFGTSLMQGVMGFVHGNTNQSRVRKSIGGISYAPKREFFKQLRELVGLPPSFYERLEDEGVDSAQVARIRSSALLSSLAGILQEIDAEMTEFASGIRYIEPIRASAERYYRLQDLAVDEIDSRGANVPMFLNSLLSYEMDHLQRWMRSSFGFHVQVKQASGHVQVEIVGEEDIANNIADLGFGFSQLLPILLQIWRSIVLPRHDERQLQPLIAVEQPELHLHPQYQSLLGDVLASVMSSASNRDGIFFVETHSEHLINRLGELIANGNLAAPDVQVIVVEQAEDRITTVQPVEFSELGYLGEGWPIGFFVPRSH